MSSPAEKCIRKKDLCSCENYSRIIQLQRLNFSYWIKKSKLLPVNGQLSAKAEGVMEYYNKKEMEELARALEYSKMEGYKIS